MTPQKFYELAEGLFHDFTNETQIIEFDVGGSLVRFNCSILEKKDFHFILNYSDRCEMELIFPAILPINSHENMLLELRNSKHDLINSRDLLCCSRGDISDIENDWMLIKLFAPTE